MDASSGDTLSLVERVCDRDTGVRVLESVRQCALDGQSPRLVADVLAAELGQRHCTMQEFTVATWEAVTQTCWHFEEIGDKDAIIGCKCLTCLFMLLDGGATNDADTWQRILLWLDAHKGAKDLVDFADSIPVHGRDPRCIAIMLETLTQSG